MTARGNIAQLLAPGLQAVMFEWLKEHPEEYSQFLEVTSTDNAYDEDQIIAGLGLAREKPENAPVTYDDPIQGGSKRYIPVTYALAWQVTMEAWQDEKYGILRKLPGELMKSCRQTWEQIGANVLNNGFSTVLTADGVSFFNTAHPLLGGGTQSNSLNPPADLSVTSLQDMLIMFEYMVNERGLKVRCAPTDLWIPPDLQFVADKILQSQLEPGTGNNDINTLRGRLTRHVLHFLTSTTKWFVSSNEQNSARMVWRLKPVADSTDDFDTGGSKHKIVFRCVAGATDYRGWAGSNI